MDIKDLQLTENDFNLLFDGLDCIPNKDAAREIMGSLLEGILDDTNLEAAEKYKRERDAKRIVADRAKAALIEDVRILQGKLLMFKRWLIQMDALKQVEDFVRG